MLFLYHAISHYESHPNYKTKHRTQLFPKTMSSIKVECGTEYKWERLLQKNCISQQIYFFQLSLNPEAEEAMNVIRATSRGSGQKIPIVSSDSYCILEMLLWCLLIRLVHLLVNFPLININLSLHLLISLYHHQKGRRQNRTTPFICILKRVLPFAMYSG